MKINAVLLAAGNSTRFKEDKLLAAWKNTYVLDSMLQILKQAPFHETIVVCQKKYVPLIQEKADKVIVNENSEKGISHSIQLGLSVCENCDAVMFLVADMPNIKLATLKKMNKLSDKEHIVCASQNGEILNPVIFPKCYFSELMQLEKDSGGKKIAFAHLDQIKYVETEKDELFDIDTKEKYQYLYDLYGKGM